MTRRSNPMNPLTRRSFFRGLGAAGVAAAGLPMLHTLDARAGGNGAPIRLLLWYQSNGYGEDVAAAHQRSLQTLDAFREKILYVRGMHLPTADGGHEGPMSTMLTGDTGGPSFDQELAAAFTEETSVSSLMLGVRSEAGGGGGHCSFLSGGNPTPRIERPEDTWATIFAGLDVGEDPEAQAQLQALWNRRGGIMDRNQQMAEALRGGLPGAQRERLDQYISSIDEIREEMTSVADTSETCVVPPEPGASPEGAWNDFSNYGPIADGQISMMAHALACDVSRVGLLQFHQATSQIQFGQVDGETYLDQHHALSHRPGEPEAEGQLTQVLDWYDAKLLSLLETLDARTDVDGSTVLDNTIIVRVTECMESNGHEFSEGHHLVLGGSNVLASGVDLTVSNDEPLWKLWKTIATAMGSGLDTVAGYSGDAYEQMLA